MICCSLAVVEDHAQSSVYMPLFIGKLLTHLSYKAFCPPTMKNLPVCDYLGLMR